MVRRLVGVLLGAAALGVTGVASTEPPPDGASIVFGEGRFRPEGGGAWRPTSTGRILGVGIVIEASGNEPLELHLPDGVAITLEPGAVGLWRPPGRLPTEHNGWARGYHLELKSGEAHFQLPSDRRGGRAFLVSTTAGTLTGWRGSVHLTVRGDTTAAAIYEGALVIGSNGQGFPVFDPSGVLMRKGVNPERARGIPGVPAFLAETPPGALPPFAVVRAEDRATLGFAWTAVPSAAAYRVEVATDAQMHRIVHRGTATASSYSVSEPAPGGRYYARVRAVDSEGIVGAWSQPRALRVLRVTYPARSLVARDGAIILPEKGFVSLGDAQGIEVAFETMASDRPHAQLPLVWMRAPGELRLGETGSRIVHLRDTSLGTETQLVLGRRELRASVELCPKRARWPEDPVNVRVVVEDPSGRLEASAEALAIETTVNLEPVDAEWRRAGASWYGRIAPQTARPGPWVVRVTVRDSAGVELNHGFLEIEGARRSTRRGDTTEIRVIR